MNIIGKTIAKLFGGEKSERDIRDIQPLVSQINEHFDQFQQLSHDELRAKTGEFKSIIREELAEIQGKIDEIQEHITSQPDMDLHEKEDLYAEIDKLTEEKDQQLEQVLENILPKAFAVVKETARRFKDNEKITVQATELDRRFDELEKDFISVNGDVAIYQNHWDAAGSNIVWNMVHYDVQLIGGVVLHRGKIAEMQTGEGKTLVSTLPSYLNALSGEGVHIVTVNDYLARRDCEWNGPILNFLGLTVDCIDYYKPNSQERREAYKSDVIYGTNNEFGFDYLRDNMVMTEADRVQRKHHFAMVDETDSVLIDDARTPLIISGPVPKGDQQEFEALKPRIQRLVEAQKKVVTNCLNSAKKEIAAGNTNEKTGGLALLRAQRGLPKNKAIIKFLSEEGNRSVLLKTEGFYLRDQAKEMPTVDEELYFVIDEKNNSVDLTEKGIELITGSGEDKDFFVMPDIGEEIAEMEKSGLSDEEKTRARDELFQDYAIKSERLHSVQQLLKAYTLFEKDIEYVVMDDKVKIVDEQTGRIMEGRRYSDGLHQAIEAKENVKVEAATQTFATVTLQNYFRMYHKLAGMTGTAETEAGEFWEIYKLDVTVIPTNRPVVRDDRDDLVYRTKREKYNALIEEIDSLRDKNRPILVGTTSVEVSELLSRMLKREGVQHNVLNAKQHQREAEIVAEAGNPKQVTIATNMAGRGTDIKISKEVKEAGGLAIIGTERHDSRRVDRQLRGRAGRQGDPGSSQFFVSMEDNLMRLFTSDRVTKMMDRLGFKEGEVIQHGMITRSIERAQKKVEENNFGVRKHLLEYDDVMNSQRELVYKKRRHALSGKRLKLDIQNTFFDICEELISDFQQASDYEGFKLEVMRVLSIEPSFDEERFLKTKVSELSDALYHDAFKYYHRKSASLAQMAMPVIEKVKATRGDTVQYIMVPFTDGRKMLNVRVHLDSAVESSGKAIIDAFEKTMTLVLLDQAWQEHLRQMDDLKQSVQAARYEQKDPLLIYKFEAFELFKQMLGDLNRELVAFLFRGSIPVEEPATDAGRSAPSSVFDSKNLQASRRDELAEAQKQIGANASRGQQQEQQKRQPVVHLEPKVGRNDPCPCGSGKKYKKCHGANVT